MTSASTALRTPGPSAAVDDHREDDRGEREDEVGGAHDDAVDDPAEVAGERAERGADHEREPTSSSASGTESRAP